MLESQFSAKLSAKKVKELDNKLTYAIGYRNLLNIIVLAFGFVMHITSTPNSVPFYVSLVIAILGAKWAITQIQENVDTLAVSEL